MISGPEAPAPDTAEFGAAASVDPPAEGRLGSVRTRVLLPLTAAIAGLIVASGFSVYTITRSEVTAESAEALDRAPKAFRAELDAEAGLMAAAMEGIAMDDAMRAAFVAGDRQALLKRAKPLFERLKRNHRITHFYFTGPERVNFLRVHQPGRHGDVIDRFTMNQAESTGKLSHGIELGPLGTFTLRAVRPWYEGHRLIGYIELGEEIEHITRNLRKSLGLEFLVAIRKSLLDRDDWQRGMRMLGRSADWELFSSCVVVDQTLETIPEGIDEHFSRPEPEHGLTGLEISLEGKRYRAAFFDLTDAGGREVGDLVALRDVSGAHAAFHKLLLTDVLTCLTAGGALLAFFYVYLGRVDARLRRQADGLAKAGEARRAAHRHLEVIVDAIPEPFLVIDREHRVVLANRIVREMAGGVDPVSAGLCCHKASHHSEAPCEGLDEPCPHATVFAEGRVTRVTHTHYTADDEVRWVEIIASPVFDDRGRVVQMIEACRDITDRKRTEQKLNESMEELSQFNEAAIGREFRMMELKREVNEYARKAGAAPPYPPPGEDERDALDSPPAGPGHAAEAGVGTSEKGSA